MPPLTAARLSRLNSRASLFMFIPLCLMRSVPHPLIVRAVTRLVQFDRAGPHTEGEHFSTFRDSDHGRREGATKADARRDAGQRKIGRLRPDGICWPKPDLRARSFTSGSWPWLCEKDPVQTCQGLILLVRPCMVASGLL